MKKFKVKGPVLKVPIRHGYMTTSAYVIKVTENAVVTICNEKYKQYYRRDDGYPKSRERSGLAAMFTPYLDVEVLEQILQSVAPGKSTYDCGLDTVTNSRGEQVYEAPECAGSTFQWIKSCGFNIVSLKGSFDK